MFVNRDSFKKMAEEFERIIASATGHDSSIVEAESPQAQRAFVDAIETGFLSSNAKAKNFVGHYVYMGDQYGEAVFKHRHMERYLRPMPYRHPEGTKTYTVLGMYGEIVRKGVIAETAVGALHNLEFGEYRFHHEKVGERHWLLKVHEPDPRFYDSVAEYMAANQNEDEVMAMGNPFDDLVAKLPSMIIPEFTPEGRARIADIEAPFARNKPTLKQRLRKALTRQFNA